MVSCSRIYGTYFDVVFVFAIPFVCISWHWWFHYFCWRFCQFFYRRRNGTQNLAKFSSVVDVVVVVINITLNLCKHANSVVYLHSIVSFTETDTYPNRLPWFFNSFCLNSVVKFRMISFSMQFANENKYFINLLNFSYVRTTHSCECEMICVWHMHDSNVMFKQLSFSPNRCVETVVNFMRSMTTIWRCFRFSNKFLFRNFFCLSNSLCFEYLICLLQTVNVNEIN